VDGTITTKVWNRRVRLTVVVVLGAAAVAAAGWLTAALLGWRGFAFAWVVNFALMAYAAAVLEAADPALGGSWFRVRPWEPPLHRRLGAWAYLRLLRRVGWERAMRAGRPFDGTRAGLAVLERATRRAELAHLLIAVVTGALAAAAAAAGARGSAAWFAGLTVALHLYPVLLQRAVRARIQALSVHADRHG
jgi:glycosyl-4,4'-diaponeurosporenoate acyltransferase